MIRAAFPGSFDPPTFGHLNLVERARMIFDEIDIVVAVNTEKQHLFSAKERLGMISELVKDWPNVTVSLCDSLVVDYLVAKNINVLIRGVRGVNDFAYEFDLSMINKGLNPKIETIFMATDPRYFVLRSSIIKELAYYGGDVSAMVPPLVAKELGKKILKKKKV